VRPSKNNKEKTVPLLEINNLEVFYGNAQAINGISFSMEEGSFISIIGPNGAGKSTLVDTISNLTKWRGQILYKGRDLKEKSPAGTVNIGIINCPERRNIFPFMTVEQNLLMGAYCSRHNVKENLEFVFELFPRLKERMKQTARTMSGGEQRMLTIGRALMSSPRLLMIDEPTVGLAPIMIKQLSKTISKLKEARRLTILLTEQNVNLAMEHSDRIFVMERGQIVKSGTPEVIAEEESLKGVYLPHNAE